MPEDKEVEHLYETYSMSTGLWQWVVRDSRPGMIQYGWWHSQPVIGVTVTRGSTQLLFMATRQHRGLYSVVAKHWGPISLLQLGTPDVRARQRLQPSHGGARDAVNGKRCTIQPSIREVWTVVDTMCEVFRGFPGGNENLVSGHEPAMHPCF